MQARSRSLRQPSYRHHKASGQAVVTVSGRDIYLGKHGTPESKKAYKRLMLEWLEADGYLPAPSGERLLLSELCNAYKRFAKRYYSVDGTPNDTYAYAHGVMTYLATSPYGATFADQFGPLALKALRSQMIREGQSRNYINVRVGCIKRAFKWAASEQIVPASVFHGLQTVDGLRLGRSEARDMEPIKPVDDAVVEATLPFLPPVVDDMVRLLRLLGCRPGELCQMRPSDVDRSCETWAYRPRKHKTQLLGRERVIYIGPRAQAILAPYLLRDASTFCFRPDEADARRRAALHESRKTPLSYGNRPGTNVARNPQRKPGETYEHDALNRAIRRACDRADKAAHEADRSVPPDVRIVPRWFTYQLRHAAATEIRKKFGLEAAQVSLGHSSADVTQIYAERDAEKAVAVMRQIG